MRVRGKVQIDALVDACHATSSYFSRAPLPSPCSAHHQVCGAGAKPPAALAAADLLPLPHKPSRIPTPAAAASPSFWRATRRRTWSLWLGAAWCTAPWTPTSPPSRPPRGATSHPASCRCAAPPRRCGPVLERGWAGMLHLCTHLPPPSHLLLPHCCSTSTLMHTRWRTRHPWATTPTFWRSQNPSQEGCRRSRRQRRPALHQGMVMAGASPTHRCLLRAPRGQPPLHPLFPHPPGYGSMLPHRGVVLMQDPSSTSLCTGVCL